MFFFWIFFRVYPSLPQWFKSKNFLESKIEQLTNDLEEGLKENDAIEEKYKNTLNKEEFASTNSDDESQKDKKNKPDIKAKDEN